MTPAFAARRTALAIALYAIALAVVVPALASCTPLGAPAPAATAISAGSTVPPPVALADKTVLDEKALAGVELAYKAARLTVETATDAGMITGARAGQIAVIDQRAWNAVQAARAAYAAGNARSCGEAIDRALVAIAEINAVAGRH